MISSRFTWWVMLFHQIQARGHAIELVLQELHVAPITILLVSRTN